MVWGARLGAVALAAGLTVGPASCTEGLDFDPDDRIIYDGPLTGEVVDCAKAAMAELPGGIVGVNRITDHVVVSGPHIEGDVSISEIAGRTTDHTALEDELAFDWLCETHTSGTARTTELTSWSLVDESGAFSHWEKSGSGPLDPRIQWLGDDLVGITTDGSLGCPREPELLMRIDPSTVQVLWAAESSLSCLPGGGSDTFEALLPAGMDRTRPIEVDLGRPGGGVLPVR